jgi:hypothetical protein
MKRARSEDDTGEGKSKNKRSVGYSDYDVFKENDRGSQVKINSKTLF